MCHDAPDFRVQHQSTLLRRSLESFDGYRRQIPGPGIQPVGGEAEGIAAQPAGQVECPACERQQMLILQQHMRRLG
jgi:hypothetical protein